MDHLTDDDLDELWRRMSRAFGHRWTTHFGKTDDGTWREGLAGVTREQLGAGYRACVQRHDDWPPSLPEFRRLCRGWPDRLAAVEQAMRGDASSPVVAGMLSAVGEWDRRQLSADALRRRLSASYSDVLDRLERHADEGVTQLADVRRRLDGDALVPLADGRGH